VVEDAGHMVHHDRPEFIASAVRDFVARRIDAAR